MEAKGHKRMMTVCACELMGTALFVFGIMSTNRCITIPFSLLAPVVIWGDITGGHFNPAVTIGVFVTLGEYSKNFMFMMLIIFAQIIGGLAAMGLFWLGQCDKHDPVIGQLAPLNPVSGTIDNVSNTGEFTMDLNVVINETVCTFIFVSVILMVKGKHTAGDRKGIGAAMCVVVTLLCVISGTNTLGACFNPAVGIALTTNSILWLGSQHYLYHYTYAYTLGPALGGLLAGLFHLNHAQYEEPVEEHQEFPQSQKANLLDY